MINREMLDLKKQLLLDALVEIDNELGTSNNFSLKKKNYYTLMLINGIYHVRYYDEKTKKEIPMKRTLNTSNRKEADKLAVKYREAFITDYYRKKSRIKDIIELFSNYYKPEKSTYLQNQLKRGDRKLSPEIIKKYDGVINNHFIPFLKENKITRIEAITLDTIKSFQDFLIGREISRNTINKNITNGVLKPIFDSVMKEKSIFNTNIKINLKGEKQKQTGTLPQAETMFILNNLHLWKLYKKEKTDNPHFKWRGTEDFSTLKKVMNEKTYKKYRLWCLISATTGLRVGEIFYLRKTDMKLIMNVPYLFVSENDGRNLKTESSTRKVPIPPMTLKALQEYVEEYKITDYFFCASPETKIDTKGFYYAMQQMAAHLGYSLQDMKDNALRFHSLRVFYKTLLNRSELKEDIVEYFMGHKIDMSSMKERYNNRNDLDDSFFQKYGKMVNDYFDSFNDSFSYSMKEVSFIDKRGNTQTYITPVTEKHSHLDFDKFSGDLSTIDIFESNPDSISGEEYN
ncbi:MAG: tyrosine-type recombinase/integrase [Prevotella sp.]|jgi:integrase|nr:tyrosine-type recombinase/integrase [Prevotella sp.]